MLLAWPLLQLLPMPESWWRALPGHEEYIVALDRFAADIIRQGGIRVAAHVVRRARRDRRGLARPAAAARVPARGDAAAGRGCAEVAAVHDRVRRHGGIARVVAGRRGWRINSRRVRARPDGIASGTFINKNHLAGLLAMTLPVLVGMIVYRVRFDRLTGLARSHSMRTAAQRALLFGSAALILVALFFTLSRAGIGTALIGLAARRSCSRTPVTVRSRSASSCSEWSCWESPSRSRSASGRCSNDSTRRPCASAQTIAPR